MILQLKKNVLPSPGNVFSRLPLLIQGHHLDATICKLLSCIYQLSHGNDLLSPFPPNTIRSLLAQTVPAYSCSLKIQHSADHPVCICSVDAFIGWFIGGLDDHNSQFEYFTETCVSILR